MANYTFKQWNDGDTNPVKTVNVAGDMTLTATYQLLAEDLKTMTFAGQVSAQAQAGETVTITITKPDGNGTAIIQALTNPDGSYQTTLDLEYATGYTAIAHVDADSKYQAADSPVVTFDVIAGLSPRTITLGVV